MADIAELRVRLTADTSGLKAGLLDVQATVNRTGGVFASLRDSITPLNQGVELLKNVFAGLARVAEGLADAFRAPVIAAAEQDQAIAGLEATLSSTSQLTAEYASNLGKLADAEALVKNVQDDVVVGAEKTLIAFGAQRDELPKLVDAVIDLSTKTGDVAGAAFLVGKAIQGETSSLSRYGIFVDEAASSTEKLDSALEQIQRRFGGQAAAAAATFSGRLGIVRIAFDQLQESIGAVITQNPVVLTALSGIALGFTKAKDAVEVFLGPLGDAVSGLVALATVSIADGLEGLAESAKDIPALATGLRAFASGLKDANTAALQAKNNLKGISEEVAKGAGGSARFSTVFKEIGATGQIVFRSVRSAISEVTGVVGTLTEKLTAADLATKPLATIGAEFKASFQEAIPAIEDALASFALNVGKKIGSRLASAIGDALLNFDFGALIEKQFGKITLDVDPPKELPPLPPLPPADLKINPVAFTIPAPDAVDLPVTPRVGAIPALAAVPLPVIPQIGSLPLLTTISLPVTPRLGPIPPPAPLDVSVEPTLRPIPAPEPIDVSVVPQLQPLPALTPVDLTVNLRPGTLPPLTTVSAQLDFDPTRALATFGRVLGVAEAEAAEIPTEFLAPPPLVLPPILAPPVTIPPIRLPDVSLPSFTVPPISLVVDNTKAQATVDATQQDAQTPLVAAFDIDTVPAESKTERFFARFRESISELVSDSFFGRIAAGLDALAKGQGFFKLAEATPAAQPATASGTAALQQTNAALQAQLGLQGQVNAQIKAAAELEAKRAPLIDANSTKLVAEFAVMSKGFAELNPNLKLGLDTTEADRAADALEQRVVQLDALEPTITPKVETPPENSLNDLEDRVRRLDGLTPTIRPTVDLTAAPGASLDDMLAKARELDTLEPDLKVVAGASFTEAQSSVTALIEQYQTLSDTPATLTADVTGLRPATEAVDNLRAATVKPLEITVDATKAQGTFSVMGRALTELEAKAAKGIPLDANIARVTEKLGIIRADISAGVDPITITAEADQAQKVIDALKASLAGITDVKLKADLQLKIDKAQADLTGLQKDAEKPATKPVDADTTEGLAKVAELQARAEAAIAAVAHGFGAIHGEAATSSDIAQTIDQLRSDLVDAIKAGDVAAQARLRGAGAEFVQTFGQRGGLTAAERKQILDLIGPFASLGQAQLLQSFAGQAGFAGTDPAVAAALQDLRSKQQETNQKLSDISTSSKSQADSAARTAAATEKTANSLSGSRFGGFAFSGVQQTAQRVTGNRSGSSFG